MKNLPLKGFLSLFLFLFNTSYAEQGQSDINLSVYKSAGLQLIGSAVGSIHNLSFNDIDDKTISLGDLGLQSNSTGNCNLSLTTVNNFKLRHHLTNGLLTNYSIKYRGTTFYDNPWWTPTLYVSCNAAPLTVDMITPALPSSIPSGVYQDTITITVVTQ